MFLNLGDGQFIRFERIAHIEPNGEGLDVYLDCEAAGWMNYTTAEPIRYTPVIKVTGHAATLLRAYLSDDTITDTVQLNTWYTKRALNQAKGLNDDR